MDVRYEEMHNIHEFDNAYITTIESPIIFEIFVIDYGNAVIEVERY